VDLKTDLDDGEIRQILPLPGFELLLLGRLARNHCCYCCNGRAIAQAVSRWLPTAAARVRARVLSCGICGGQTGAGAGFL
jgi:hypothetical protein